jgi:quercetin dioxygenase-like cupin family protein
MTQKRRRYLAPVVLAMLPVALASTASGTPSSSIDPTPHVARATIKGPVKANADGIRLKTKEPTDVSVVTLTIAPGGSTGWHRHPGVVLIAVTEGTGTFYAADCTPTPYSAGDVFVETGEDSAAVVRNESASAFVITVTFFVPHGAPFRIDERNPGCPGIE